MVVYDLLRKMVADIQSFSERHLAGVLQTYISARRLYVCPINTGGGPGGNRIQYTS